MLDKLRAVADRYEELCARSEQPDFYADPQAAARFLREKNDLEPIVEAYHAYNTALRDMEDALERFNEKFDCGQIDIFCIVIRQSMESGRSVKVLEDLSLQMNDLQKAINTKEKEALDRKVQVIELLLFVGLLAVTVYGMGVEVLSSIMIF